MLVDIRMEVKLKRLKAKCWSLLSTKIRKQAGKCQRCGTTKNLNVHHWEDARLCPELFLDEANLVCLCARCHRFSKDAVHRSAIAVCDLIKVLNVDVKYLYNMKLAHANNKFQFTEEYLLKRLEELSGKKKNSKHKRSR